MAGLALNCFDKRKTERPQTVTNELTKILIQATTMEVSTKIKSFCYNRQELSCQFQLSFVLDHKHRRLREMYVFIAAMKT